MRALLIHQAFVAPGESGGTRHYEFASYLVKRWHSFTIVASDTNYLTGKRLVQGRRLVTEQDCGGVRVLRAYTYPSLHKGFVWRGAAFLSFTLTSIWAALRVGHVDVMMGTSPPLPQALSAWVVAVVRRVPLLLEIRDLWPEFAIGMGVLRNLALIWLARRLEAFLYARASHLLVNSPAYRDYLLGKGIPVAKITLIANGVDPTLFQPDSDGAEVRSRLGLNGKFVVTYAGALGKANDIETLLRAAQRLKDTVEIHFLLVGDGMDRPRLEQVARDWQLPNVTFTGAVPKGEMAAILAASDAGVAILKDIPMFQTTYPNKVFDYMAAGRPTLLAIDGVIREVVEAAEGGLFVPPGDDEALAEAVLELSRDSERAQAMGRKARAYVVEHFNRERQAQDFGALLERLARGERDA